MTRRDDRAHLELVVWLDDFADVEARRGGVWGLVWGGCAEGNDGGAGSPVLTRELVVPA